MSGRQNVVFSASCYRENGLATAVNELVDERRAINDASDAGRQRIAEVEAEGDVHEVSEHAEARDGRQRWRPR